MTELIGLYISRVVLGGLSVLGIARLQSAVDHVYGADVAFVYVLIIAGQFHLPFYFSRTLPNTYASVISNVAMADWIRQPKSKRALWMLIAATICFRCDVILLLAPFIVHGVRTGQLKILDLIRHGPLAIFCSLLCTVSIDSWFWKRWVWPEGEVFYFNAILNRSVEWGIMPFHWYFTSALPKSLLVALPLNLCAAFLDRRTRSLNAIVWSYVLLYSRLSHKEVRFLFPVLSLFNIPAAVAFVRIWRRGMKSWMWRCISVGCLLASLLSLCATVVFLTASAWNYPGGYALKSLHTIAGYSNFFRTPTCVNATESTVHLAVYSKMTGITRFSQLPHCWSYITREDLTTEGLIDLGYDYLVTDQPSFPGYHSIGAVKSFAGYDVSFPSLLRLKTEEAVYLLMHD